MYDKFQNIDRRWIFLLMGLSIAIPILLQLTFPDRPTGLSRAFFQEIDKLKEGDKVMLAFDYDPASEGELGPMATAVVRHCCEKKLKMYFISLWPLGPQMIEDKIDLVIESDYPQLVYGEDYVNLGFKSGYEAVIKVIVTDLRALYSTDSRGTNINLIPMCKDVENVQDMMLVCNVSAGYPGSKEWVQYAATPYPDTIRIVSGSTGVQSPLMYPYIPTQLPGLLGGIKGAAEYEQMVNSEYGGEEIDAKYQEAHRRMGPQTIAHILMILLILAGNVLFFVGRAKGRQTP